MASESKKSCSFCSGTGKISSALCLRNLPPGYAFNPSDEDLIRHYLHPKNQGTKLPQNLIIEYDVYKAHPEELTKKFEPNGDGPSWYFFFKRQSRVIGCKPDSARTVYATGTNSEAGVQHRNVIGYWRTFHISKIEVEKNTSENYIGSGTKLCQIFLEKSTKSGRYTSTDWFMNEYWSHPSNPGDMMLCTMYKKSSRNSETELDAHTEVNDAVSQIQEDIFTPSTESEEATQPLN